MELQRALQSRRSWKWSWRKRWQGRGCPWRERYNMAELPGESPAWKGGARSLWEGVLGKKSRATWGHLGGSVGGEPDSWVQLRSWSHSSWVRALRWALYSAQSLLGVLPLPLSLPLPHLSLSLSPSLSLKINKLQKKLAGWYLLPSEIFSKTYITHEWIWDLGSSSGVIIKCWAFAASGLQQCLHATNI